MSLLLQDHVDLLPYNTFHVSCIARYFIEILVEEQLVSLITDPLFQTTNQRLILWGGSNMLFATDTFDGLVIKNSLLGKEIIDENDTTVTLRIGAGEARNELVWRTIDQGRTWLENLVSIPGTVGAAPVQNIGAYGAEAKDTIVGVEGIDLRDGQKTIFSHEACGFGYRTSVFKRDLKDTFFITAVHFRLEKYDQNTYIWNVNYEGVAERTANLTAQFPHKHLPRAIASAIAQIRAEKLPDPGKIGTAWSFFQNPVISQQHYTHLLETTPQLKWRPQPDGMVKLSAGQLIELVWLKGYQEHGVGVYEKHALVLVNYTSTAGSDLLQIITRIITTVSDRFTVQLVPEVIIIWDEWSPR